MTQQKPAFTEKQISQIMIAVGIVVNLSGINVTIMEPDGALYAGIAKHMVQAHNYMDLWADGMEWLDKPHFPFWMMALSYRVLGFTTVAYKLPALLYWGMGVVYTYFFAKGLYNEKVARWSVCVLLTAQHLLLSNNDVRAEPYLMGLIIGSVYHFYRSLSLRVFSWHLLLGALFAACAVMTKGPFALVPVGAAIGGHLLFTRNFKQVFSLRWVIAFLLVGVFITPELYALYTQFDMHPEKQVFGQHGVSGLRFFFWDSQFGRFMNTGPIKGNGDPTFFLHTLLWAFLPWSVLLYAALVVYFQRFRGQVEYFNVCGALATFLMFSLSRFQLPHYLNIIFPFFAILTAQYVLTLGTLKFYRVTQYVIIGIVAVALVGICVLYRPPFSFGWALVGAVILVGYFALRRLLTADVRALIFFRTMLASFAVNIFMNGVLYPDIMQYQSGSTAARYANAQLAGQPVGCVRRTSYSFEYYLKAPLVRYAGYDAVPAGAVLFLAPQQVDTLASFGHKVDTLRSFAHFYVTKLDGPFMNFDTRKAVLGERLLVRVL
ncbi:ArnT family glycosyltransferase [Chitinophaga parva]|nr:glycosyltransferase family 39 protein [Chitinophaga parva]